jgi:hypothetical protein
LSLINKKSLIVEPEIFKPVQGVYEKNNDAVEYIQILKNTGGFSLYFTIVDPATNTYYRNP